MNILERCLINFRQNALLNKANWLWDMVRPCYDRVLPLLFRSGIERTINGTDSILLLPKFRQVSETYEPDVWKHLMAQVRDDDIIADTGAFIGLYTIALAKRLGPSGKVFAFEPQSENFVVLKTHVDLNSVSNRVELIEAAVGSRDGVISLEGHGLEARVSYVAKNITQMIRVVRLDTVFANNHLDILKIDVEGYEEEILKGGINLLQDRHRGPRIIYIETHPYLWPITETVSGSILNLLKNFNCRFTSSNGEIVENIKTCNRIIAYRKDIKNE